jgi:hypothetical protein
MHASLPKAPRRKYKPCPFTVVNTPRMMGHVAKGSSCLGQHTRRINLQRNDSMQENVYMKMMIQLKTFDPHDVYGQRILGDLLAPRWQPLAVKDDKVCVAVYFASFPETAFDVELRKAHPHVFDDEASLRKARQEKIIAALWKLGNVYGKVKHVSMLPPNSVTAYNRRAGLVFYEYKEEAEMLCFDLNKRVITTYDMHGNIDETVTMHSKIDMNTTDRLPKGTWWEKWKKSRPSNTTVVDAVPFAEGITGELPTLRREERDALRLSMNEFEADKMLLSTVKLNSKKEKLEGNLKEAVGEVKKIESVILDEEKALSEWTFCDKKKKKKKKDQAPTTPVTESQSRLGIAARNVKTLQIEIDHLNDDTNNRAWPNVRGIFTPDMPMVPSPLMFDDADATKALRDKQVEDEEEVMLAIVSREQETKLADMSEAVEQTFFDNKTDDVVDDKDKCDMTVHDMRRLCRRLISV